MQVEQIELLFWSIQQRRPPEKQPIIVPAAGNGEQRCTLPASLTDVIAVGVYDLERHEVPDYARYEAVPPGRFVMAPGGSREQTRAFSVATNEAGRPLTPLYGTSFAAPIVTGVAARYLADRWCPACETFHGWPDSRPVRVALECIARSARPPRGFDPARHGLGVLSYDRFVSHSYPGREHESWIGHLLGRYPDSLRAMVGQEARRIYEQRGSPNDQADEHWRLARRRCGIRDELHV